VSDVQRLLDIMARLRDPEHGCPWDLDQTFETIAPYTVEEAYEVAEAVSRGDARALADELGDLLFQVVFHARMAEERGEFRFDDVVAAVVDKMVRRHPHVFGAARVASADAQSRAWEAQKAAERAARGAPDESALDGVPAGLPALPRAQKLQARAARVGFDWPAADGVLDKVAEELEEVREALAGGDRDAAAAELGDLLFACVNLARHVGADPEMALRAASGRFERRFRRMEAQLQAAGRSVAASALDELEAHWRRVKAEEDR